MRRGGLLYEYPVRSVIGDHRSRRGCIRCDGMWSVRTANCRSLRSPGTLFLAPISSIVVASFASLTQSPRSARILVSSLRSLFYCSPPAWNKNRAKSFHSVGQRSWTRFYMKTCSVKQKLLLIVMSEPQLMWDIETRNCCVGHLFWPRYRPKP